MEHIKSKLGKAGLVVAALGIMSIVLSIFNYNVRILAWIDSWGSTVGWALRILFVLLGGALFIFFGRTEEEA
ncbi:hypothetical protein G5B37_02195 [Rasiella rasia]|uniref:DUF378 domain-containing protein n=1 Tax=Rasiella rasia TaxID=2744027 RepID=A0A6G6GIL3_9FLAO|nr:hypothetical protein [Rasiella rasia]QIE58415.1 hypothetical protein G5B37_02195 [Rasiella rasia]